MQISHKIKSYNLKRHIKGLLKTKCKMQTGCERHDKMTVKFTTYVTFYTPVKSKIVIIYLHFLIEEVFSKRS